MNTTSAKQASASASSRSSSPSLFSPQRASLKKAPPGAPGTTELARQNHLPPTTTGGRITPRLLYPAEYNIGHGSMHASARTHHSHDDAVSSVHPYDHSSHPQVTPRPGHGVTPRHHGTMEVDAGRYDGRMHYNNHNQHNYNYNHQAYAEGPRLGVTPHHGLTPRDLVDTVGYDHQAAQHYGRHDSRMTPNDYNAQNHQAYTAGPRHETPHQGLTPRDNVDTSQFDRKLEIFHEKTSTMIQNTFCSYHEDVRELFGGVNETLHEHGQTLHEHGQTLQEHGQQIANEAGRVDRLEHENADMREKVEDSEERINLAKRKVDQLEQGQQGLRETVDQVREQSERETKELRAEIAQLRAERNGGTPATATSKKPRRNYYKKMGGRNVDELFSKDHHGHPLRKDGELCLSCHSFDTPEPFYCPKHKGNVEKNDYHAWRPPPPEGA